MTGEREANTTRAEQVLIEFLARSRAGDGGDFEQLCSEHADIEAELRELHDAFRRVEGLVGRSMTPSVSDLLTSRYGASVDPGITLDPVERPSSVFIDQLGERTTTGMRYAVGDEIARGGMGVILEVWDQDLRRTLAMKALAEERAKTSDGSKPPVAERTLARFLEEAQITGQLGHPGILPVHEIGLDPEGRVFFTMPLVHGRDFKDVITLARKGQEGWNLTKALRVVMKVCEAVAYSHSRGVIHRDLKPANVMVGRFGETYVMDWGLARVVGREDSHDIRIRPERTEGEGSSVETNLSAERASSPSSPLVTMDGAVLGTPAFMSPEQVAGRIEELDGRTDVYSIGAMLYQLLSGRMPYCPSGAFVLPRTVLTARKNGPPTAILKLDPEAPRELVDVCEKAMATDPDERYGSPLELAEDVENYLTRRPVSAREATVLYQVALAYQRNKTLVNTVVVAAVALAAASWLFLAERAEARQRAFDIMSARSLTAEVDELFPALPATIPALETWIAGADALRARAWRWEREASRDGSPKPEVAAMLASLDRLDELRPAVENRLQVARGIGGATTQDEWQRAIEAVAAAPAYGGLSIEPVQGLIPLGPDPESGLWEFWNVLSGDEPQRDPTTGSIRPASGDGIVLVLVPGGSFRMGQREGEEDTRPAVGLGPFYMGKYEVTQAQWTRVMGSNPSGYPAGLVLPADVSPLRPGARVTDLHPVEFVGWHQAAELARRLRLGLPTEEQWERAARAGTDTAWYWGDAPADLEGKSNLRDLSAEAFGRASVDWDDGFTLHAPVGSFPPNGLGLHDMIGNVREWCDNWRKDDWLGEGIRKGMRGTSFAQEPGWGTSGFEGYQYPHDVKFTRGARLALSIE